jgi:hypothetical protein
VSGDALTALMEQWREGACDDHYPTASVFAQCADELAALLQAAAPPALQPCALCGTEESMDGDWYHICGSCRWVETEPDAAAQPAPTAEPLSHAHRWMLERLRDKLKAEEFGHQDFPLIQALEAALAAPPERVSEEKE